MRVRRLRIAGFRAFPGDYDIDLDADAVVISGANGQGKTSLFDAMLWCLTGGVDRLGGHYVSLYSRTGTANVELDLVSELGSVTATRSTDGESDRLVVRVGDESYEGDAATTELARLLWPAALTSDDPSAAMRNAFVQGVYLQQDLVRSFVDADDPADRFRAVSELVGVGQITQLQSLLERERRAWSRATNEIHSESEALRQQLAALESRDANMEAGVANAEPVTDTDWHSWWDQLGQSTTAVVKVPSLDSEASMSLDRAMRTLGEQERAVRRSVSEAEVLVRELEEADASAATDDLEPISDEELERLRANVTSSAQALEDARAAARLERERLAKLTEAAEEIRALASLALRHLDGDCPVCGQEHDTERTRSRLMELGVTGGDPVQPREQVDVVLLSEAAEVAQRELATAEQRLESWTRRRRQLSADAEERAQRGSELGITFTSEAKAGPVVSAWVDERRHQLEAMQATRVAGEQLALRLARQGDVRRRTELRASIERVRSQLAPIEADLIEREVVGDRATAAIEALRDSGSQVVDRQLVRVRPLLQRIYGALDPHPSLSQIELPSSMHYGKGRLEPRLTDTAERFTVNEPASVLSSSQVNALALSIFLSFNLGFSDVALRTTMLDDPLQSLDDVNLLGVVDVLRRLRERRQLLVSTHDERFARLLLRKLRPVLDGQRTVFVRLEGWDRAGPIVTQESISGDGEQLHLVS